MSVHYHSNGGGGDPDWGSWIPIVVLFCIPTPFTWIIGFFWLVSKLRGTKFKTGSEVKRHPYDMEREARAGQGEQAQTASARPAYNAAARPAGQTARRAQPAKQPQKQTAAKSASPKAQKKAAPKQKKIKSGIGRMLLGGAVALGCGIAALVLFIEGVRWGFWNDLLVAFALCSCFAGAGAGLFCNGFVQKKRAERYVGYLGYIGSNREVPLAHMAASFGVSVHKLCADLRRMLNERILPTGYLDLAEGRLYLTEEGYRAHPAPEEAREEAKPTAEEVERQENAILREIRQVNDDIPGEEMSAKIDRIEEITRKIFAYQKQHPDREKQLRSFLNYYLPTTLKILRAYAQLDAQGIEGENITAAKARIEGMMDQVVAGFEKQLDRLFQDDAMDIATDVQVLENMLKKDGLSGEGMTLEL